MLIKAGPFIELFVVHLSDGAQAATVVAGDGSMLKPANQDTIRHSFFLESLSRVRIFAATTSTKIPSIMLNMIHSC